MNEAEFKPIWTSLLHRHQKQAERLTDQDWDNWLTKLGQFEPKTIETALQEWYKIYFNRDQKRFFPELNVVRNICIRLVDPPQLPELERDMVATEAYCRANGLPIDVPEGKEAKEAYRQAHIDHCKEKLRLIGSKKSALTECG